ncbi:MAG: sulfatase-like hydrolase/transferase [Candidatus Hydrogenedentes bacterium]|nr:sulfatase-like hydrolase/transferase [Candidatus Hydrogenedentota bacterium]
MKMRRRTFLQSVGAAALAARTAAAQSNEIARPASAGDSRPNILFIMPDQMRGDAMSIARHPVLLTPNIDAIAAQGTRFARGYTTCPSCIPARRSLLTGLHPASNGLVGYQEGVPLKHPAFPQLMLDSGYSTVLVGRNMHQSPYETPYGYEKRVLGSNYIEGDEYAKDFEAELPGIGGTKSIGISFNGWAARPWPYPDHLHLTQWTATKSRQALEEHDETRPLFLTSSYIAPHPPLIPPAFYYERYHAMQLPDAAIGTWEKRPENDGLGLGVDSHHCVLEGEALRGAQSGYFGLINHLDDQISWLVSEFRTKSRKMGRPWVIVFTSDHGEMLGDHYLFRKCEPYEGSARIPFLIAGSPDLRFKTGQVSQQPVCLEDLMPTLLELSGVDVPSGLDGRSLVPALRGDESPVRPWLHMEHAPCYGPEQAFHSLTDGHSKFIWRPVQGEEQLFDLDTDPQEKTDLSQSAAHAAPVREWRNRLITQLKDRPEGFTDGQQLIAGRPYTNLVGA